MCQCPYSLEREQALGSLLKQRLPPGLADAPRFAESRRPSLGSRLPCRKRGGFARKDSWMRVSTPLSTHLSERKSRRRRWRCRPSSSRSCRGIRVGTVKYCGMASNPQTSETERPCCRPASSSQTCCGQPVTLVLCRCPSCFVSRLRASWLRNDMEHVHKSRSKSSSVSRH